jgi:histidine triad (HIT) family protein
VRPSRRKGSSLPEDCLFCKLVQEGDHVAKGDGFVAIRDINPRADTHLLVLPERHVSTFREIGEFPPDEAKRMLDFVAETAREAGLDDYRVVVNVGEGGGPVADIYGLGALASIGGGFLGDGFRDRRCAWFQGIGEQTHADRIGVRAVVFEERVVVSINEERS